ncbi:MAG: anhydro-N-acetylmuramic acid kinase [Spirochaetes bacterium]|nr:anhydro-N-acetylmuramic acid kinase [Spirochaetota bacterium]
MDGYIGAGREAYRREREHFLVGIMSGTSLDGIDAVLTRIETAADGGIAAVELVGQSSLSYTSQLKKILLALCSPSEARIDDLVYAHFGLSEWYVEAVHALLAATKCPAEKIAALCLHGQTVWHAPQTRLFPAPDGGTVAVKGTLQIGAAPVLTERLGIPVIFDFRSRDMAAGGEGAPLAPCVDALLFGSPVKGRIVQNIGGIGNATVVPAGSMREGVFAFDTGPGNMIIDELARRDSSGALQYDEDGRRGRAGRVDEAFVSSLAADPWFSVPPPKSTGREVYGSAFVDRFVAEGRRRGLAPDDLIATATAFAAETIAASYRDFIYSRTRIDEVVAGGGGALNSFLMDQLQERLAAGVSLLTTADLGVPELAREAIAFAVLGHEALMGRPGNLPEVTGASREVILGNMTL